MDAAEVRDLISCLEQDVDQCLEDGKKQYKVLMDSLLESKHRFKDSQLLHFHQRNVEIIKEAFDKSYEESIKIPQANISHKIKQLLSNAKHELEVQTTKEFITFVRNHLVLMERNKNRVKDLSLEALKYYDEHLQQRLSFEISLGELIMTHWTWEQKAMTLLDQLLLENDFEKTSFWKHDLADMLQQRVKELIFKMDPISTNSDPCSQITYMLELVKEDLLQCINEGLASYTAFMESLLEPNQPLTDSQIFQFHSNVSEAINNAVDASYTDTYEICNIEISSKIWHLVSQAKTGLNTLLRKHYHTVVLRKHEIQIDGIVKKIKGFTTQAEMLYDEKAEQPKPGIPKNEVLIAHEGWAADAVKLFDDCLAESNVESQDFWKFELKQRLKELEKDLIEEYDLPSSPLDQNPDISQANTPNVDEFGQPFHETPHNGSNGVPAPSQEEKHIALGSTGVAKKQSGPPQPPIASQFSDTHSKKEENKKIKIKKPPRLTVIIPQPPTSLPVQLPARQEIDLGIYFGDNSFEVGIYHPNPKPNYPAAFEKVTSIAPKICLLNDQPYVVLGQAATSYGNTSCSNNNNCRYFDLRKLITAPNEIVHNSFSIKNNSYILCTHQIMAIFIKHVACSLEDRFGKKIGNAVFTIPFTPTSATKERLQRSAEIAGLKKSNVRILSTLSTMAIAALKTESENNYTGFLGAQGSQLLTNHVLVLDVQRNYFSIGVVELSPAKVTLKSAYGSANLVPPSDRTFSELHSSLYSGLPLPFEYDTEVRQVYRDAVSYVLSHTEGLTSLAALVVNENISIHIPKLVQKFVQETFKNFNTISVCSPLEGASLLALSTSKYIEKSSYLLLPPSLTGIEIQETSRFDLLLVVGKTGNKRDLFSLQGKIFGGRNKQVFSETYALNGSSSIIELYEVCGRSIEYEVSRRLVFIKNSGSFLSRLWVSQVELEINGSQDADGILTLNADSPHMSHTDLQRSDISCRCYNLNWGHFKEVMKLVKTAIATAAD